VSDATDLYRYFDAEQRLLYVGISFSALNRAIQHKSSAKWWSEQRTMTRETHPTRSAAEEAERRAIATEKPIHNIVHNGQGVKSAPPKEPPPATSGLVGKFFLTPDPDKGFPLVQRQGWVLEELASGTYLIELFSWADGCPNGQHIAPLADMGEWRFYSDESQWLKDGQRGSDLRSRAINRDVLQRQRELLAELAAE
jgi:hypothetical protein